MTTQPYLGYRAGDRDTPYGDFFRPQMAALPRDVAEALEHGPQAGPTLLRLQDAPFLLEGGYHETENGYGVLEDGTVQVSVRTEFPEADPGMLEWWIGWHGEDSRRYKLWHPRAHVAAAWADGDGAARRGAERYVGRTSLVDEYVGSMRSHLAIRFLEPRELGLPAAGTPGPTSGVAICARVGARDQPVDFGWLVHQVRPVPGGCEMRSRFWLAGPQLATRGGGMIADRLLRAVLSSGLTGMRVDGRDLFVHCAQEMNHLATFLPALHARCGAG